MTEFALLTKLSELLARNRLEPWEVTVNWTDDGATSGRSACFHRDPADPDLTGRYEVAADTPDELYRRVRDALRQGPPRRGRT